MTWYIIAFVVSTAMLVMTAVVEARVTDTPDAAAAAAASEAGGESLVPIESDTPGDPSAPEATASEPAPDNGQEPVQRELLQQIDGWMRSVPGIEGWAVLDSEGLIVTGELPEDLRAGVEALDPAAFTRRATRLLHSGWWQRLTLENQSVSLLLQPLPGKYLLLALVKSGYDMEVTWHRLEELQAQVVANQ